MKASLDGWHRCDWMRRTCVPGMNRHHYSLFIRNCHLVLLRRQEPAASDDDDDDEDDLRPAEWRWQLPQVCDNHWHHYAVSMQSLEVSSSTFDLVSNRLSLINLS